MREHTSGCRPVSRPAPASTTIALFTALLISMFAAVPAGAQLANGSFENSPQTTGYTTVSAPSFIDAAHTWKVTLGSVNTGTGPAGTRCVTSASHCIDLNGNSRGRIEQAMSIISGSQCTVTFYMSRHKNLAGGSATLNTFINSASTPAAAFTHSVGGVTPTNGQWQQHSFPFTATGATTTLAFESAVQGAAGPQVDDVTMRCVAPVTTGSLTARKIVVNTLGVPTPMTFNLVTHCSANAASPATTTPVSVAAGQSVLLSTPIAAGSLCSVTEAVPPPVPNVRACKGGSATWTATYSAPVTIVAGATSVLAVTNTLTCDPPKGGHLTVNKHVVNTLGVPTPATFAIVAHCSAPGLLTAPLNVPAGQSVAIAAPIAAGSICSLTEVLPPSVPNVKACRGGSASWSQNIPGPVTMADGVSSVMIFTNTLTCDKINTGSLSVHKIVVNTLGVPNPPTFNTTTHCSANAATLPLNTAVAVAGGQTITQSTPVATGSQCSVTEVVPPPALDVRACKGGSASWTAAYSSPVTIVAGGNAVLTVTNTLTCDEIAGGHLTVHKVVVNTLGVPNPRLFHVVAHCSPSGPMSTTLPLAAGQSASVAAPIAGGSTCTITEVLPPSVPNVKACRSGSASWSQANSGPVTIATGATTMLTVTNTLTCDKPMDTGSLHVVKSVVNRTGGAVAMPATFAMTVSCTPSGPTNHALSVAPGATGTTINGIAAPSQCTVTETPLAQIAHLDACHGGSASWATVVSPAQPMGINANATTTATVRNTITCDKPNSTDCLSPSQTYIGCRVTITIKRSKGPAMYSVVVSPPATTPTPNIAPSTSSACVIAGGAMINQTTCWFNYNTLAQPVTLTATSSSGALPAGFKWTGNYCNMSTAAICSVNAALVNPPIVVANFP